MADREFKVGDKVLTRHWDSSDWKMLEATVIAVEPYVAGKYRQYVTVRYANGTTNARCAPEPDFIQHVVRVPFAPDPASEIGHALVRWLETCRPEARGSVAECLRAYADGRELDRG